MFQFSKAARRAGFVCVWGGRQKQGAMLFVWQALGPCLSPGRARPSLWERTLATRI
ncbi:hypothetical protein CCP2SC5_600019 [Azospirillaceae bacterium]